MHVDAYMVLKKGSAKVGGEASDLAIVKAIELTEFSTGTDNSFYDRKDLKKEHNLKMAPYTFQIRKQVDVSSPTLFRAYADYCARFLTKDEFQFSSAEINFRKAGGKAEQYRAYSGTVYLKVTFENLLLVKYTFGDATSGSPTETIRFAFQKCKLSYQQQSEEGKTAPPAPEIKGWDFTSNTPPKAPA
jgi:type VI protein secretion system component Hcp